MRKHLFMFFVLCFAVVSLFGQPVTKVRLLSLDFSRYLNLSWAENDAANRTLQFYVNGGDRIIDLSGNFILSGSNQVASWTVSDLTPSRAIVSGAGGLLTVSATTDTEVGYLSGVTSGVQTQLNGKEPTITAGTTAQYWRGDKSWQTFTHNLLSASHADTTAAAGVAGDIIRANPSTAKWERLAKPTNLASYLTVSGSTVQWNGMEIRDSDNSDTMGFCWDEDSVAHRWLNWKVNGNDRTLNLSGNFTLSGNNTVASWTATTAVYSPTVYGGTGAGGDLHLGSTSNAAKGKVIVDDPLKIISTARNLKTWWDYCEFVKASVGDTIYISLAQGTGAISTGTLGTLGRPGMWHFSTGTTNAGYALLATNATAFRFSAGVYTFETDIQLPALSTADETYAARIGFGDSIVGGAHTDGACFYYSDAGANPNWYRNTASNTALTSTDTGVAATVNWTRLKIVVNADGTAVEFFIDGVSVGTNTTNIPTGSGRNCGVVLSVLKSNGTTARLLYIDWAWLHVDLTTSR